MSAPWRNKASLDDKEYSKGTDKGTPVATNPQENVAGTLDTLQEPDVAALGKDEAALENNAARRRSDVPPDGGYGWVCVAVCFMLNAHTWGMNSVS